MEFTFLNFRNEKIKILKKYIYFTVIIFAFAQLIISSFEVEVFYIIGFIIISSLFTLHHLNEENLKYYLVPTFVVLSLYFSCLFGPLIFKTFFFQKISSNLYYPLHTFLNFMIYLIVISFSLQSVKFLKIFKFSKLNLFKNLKVFETFNEKNTLILLILIFLIRFYTGYVDQGINQNLDQGNIFIRILEGMEKFFYLPILFFLYINLNKKSMDNKFIVIFFIYLIYSIFLSLSLNQRSHFFEFIFVILFLLIISNLYYEIKNFKFMFFILLLIILVSPLLSKTILVNREFKDELSASDLITKSVKKNKYIEYKLKSITDENYTENAIVDRLILIKYYDRSYALTRNFSENQKDIIRDFTKSRAIAVLPQNFINFFLTNFDKKNYMISMGSFTERLNGINGGNFTIGSFLMESKLLFDKFNWVIIYLLFLLLFIFLQQFQIIYNDKIKYSLLIFIQVLELYHLAMSDSLVDFFYIFRTLIQYSIIYFFLVILLNQKIKK